MIWSVGQRSTEPSRSGPEYLLAANELDCLHLYFAAAAPAGQACRTEALQAYLDEATPSGRKLPRSQDNA